MRDNNLRNNLFSNRTFPYDYLVTTSFQSVILQTRAHFKSFKRRI